jgi:hypothetical protein
MQFASRASAAPSRRDFGESSGTPSPPLPSPLHRRDRRFIIADRLESRVIRRRADAI